jgi:hypothetical protein
MSSAKGRIMRLAQPGSWYYRARDAGYRDSPLAARLGMQRLCRARRKRTRHSTGSLTSGQS